MRLLVCGSRTFKDYELMTARLQEVAPQATTVITGGMAGADALAAYWAYQFKIDTECYGAKWGAQGNSAGPIRNQRMLDEGKPDLVVAFYDKARTRSRGTAHMVSIARQAGVNVVEVGPV